MAKRTVYGNDTSSNGWPMVDEGSCEWTIVPGTDPPVKLEIQQGLPLNILRAFAADFNAYVEHLNDSDSACWTADNSVSTSNHLSGTAMDLNWDAHPFQVADAGFDSTKIATIREILDFYEGTVFWGNDWDSPKDAMHFQLGSLANGGPIDTFNNQHTQDFIDRKIRSDGFSTFRRGTTPPAPVTGKDQYALAIIAEGQRRGITKRGICIAFATVLVESNFQMYANESVPDSMSIPHDAVGSDFDSVGLFQQRCPMWGPANVLMDPALSAGLFYDHLAQLNYNDESQSPGSFAQAVQVSAFPDRYDGRWDEAVALYDRLVGQPPTPPSDRGELTPEQDRMLRELHAVWCTDRVASTSIYGDPTIKWFRKDKFDNMDGFLYDVWTEREAALGDQQAFAQIRAAAATNPIASAMLKRLTTTPPKESNPTPPSQPPTPPPTPPIQPTPPLTPPVSPQTGTLTAAIASLQAFKQGLQRLIGG